MDIGKDVKLHGKFVQSILGIGQTCLNNIEKAGREIQKMLAKHCSLVMYHDDQTNSDLCVLCLPDRTHLETTYVELEKTQRQHC